MIRQNRNVGQDADTKTDGNRGLDAGKIGACICDVPRGLARRCAKNAPARSLPPKNGDQRLGRASLTRGNVAGSHTPGTSDSGTGRRIRKVMVVALAQKLLIALWRFATQGVVPEGTTGPGTRIQGGVAMATVY